MFRTTALLSVAIVLSPLAQAAVPTPPPPPPLHAKSAPALAAAPGSGKVTLDLVDFERLRQSDERPSLTVVDLLRIQGSFRAKDLAIQFSGRATGKLPTEPLFTASQGVRLYGCEGDAIVSRADEGRFSVTPLAARFMARCRVATTGSDRVQMTASKSVLWVESAVADGEFVATDEPSGERSFSVVRQTGTAAETVKPSATARYRLSLFPEETRFRYQLDVRNPNRMHHAFDVVLLSGEAVQQVDARATYDVEKGRYRFDLPPGESSIVILGTLPKSSFVPPVSASVSYALIESHPLLRTEVIGAAKRVAQSEVGLASQFRGAQAFLLASGESLSWKVTRLEALRATSFAVSAARHVFFLTRDGKALGETTLAIDNQGAPDITLPMKSEPTFASIQGTPVLLTKNKEGNLWLPISQGRQDVVTQHRQTFDVGGIFASASVFLPQVAVPASSGNVELRYPNGWVPIYEAFDNETRFWLPSYGESLAWLLLLLWTERVLAGFGLLWRRRVFVTLAVGAGATSALAFEAVVVANALVSILWLVVWIRGMKTQSLRIAAVSAVLLVVLGAGLFALNLMPGGAYKNRASEYAMPSAPAPYAVQKEESKLKRVTAAIAGVKPDAASGTTSTETANALSYQGLPARIDLPYGRRQTYFRRDMMASDPPRAAHVLLVSSGVILGLEALLGLLAVIVVVLSRRVIATGARALFDRAKGNAAGTPAP